jgi:pyruvate dehydrogenase E1 component beta subunit
VTVLKYWQAINLALHEELSRDRHVVLFGEDVAAPGGPFGASKGLLSAFGQRVRDTPISEATITGMAVGAAASGVRPVLEIMFADFMTLAMDQVVNQAAKTRYMSAGAVAVPLTIRTMCGAHRGAGPQHSQSVEAWFVSVPGLSVVAPGTPSDAKGLLKAAIRSNDPVIVFESLALWNHREDVSEDPEFLVPLGQACVRTEGNDITLVCWGGAVPRVLAAASALTEVGVSAEVVDLRTLSPLDHRTIADSVRKTGRLLVVQDAVAPCSVGSEVVRVVTETAFGDLREAPVVLAPPFAPVPFPAQLGAQYFPGLEDVVRVGKRLMGVAA